MKFILIYSLLMFTSATHASSWRDMWQNTNQRAASLMQQEAYEQAEKTFTRKDWRAVAAFRAKHYTQAAKSFQAQENAEGFYNQGNALAFQGKYKQAIEAYTQALKLEPNHLDAEYNRALVEAMLKNNPPEPDESNEPDNSDSPDDSDSSDKSDDSKQSDSNAGNDEGNSNQENTPKNDAKQNTSDQKQDGSNNTPSKPEPPESNHDGDHEPEQEADAESKSPPESKAKPKEHAEKKDQPDPEPSQHADASPTDADKQAKEQWLRLIPDDPGGLLREKFWRDHMKRLQQRRS